MATKKVLQFFKVKQEVTSIEPTTSASDDNYEYLGDTSGVGGGSGGAVEASQVKYENSKTNLQYITGYDFPKIKLPIPETIDLVLTDGKNDYPATITKQEDGSYVLNAGLTNFKQFLGAKAIAVTIKSIKNETNSLVLLNMINMFWNNNLNTTSLITNNGDINIENVTETLQFAFFGTGIAISKTDNTDFDMDSAYNITLTIKNRQYYPVDTYFLGIGGSGFTANYLSCTNLQNNNGFVKFVGTLTGTGTDSSGTTSSYSFIATLNNYFNLVSSGNYVDTTQITSNTGKAVKYYFMQNASYENAVDLVIAYQDGSTINTNDVFTLNLTPDKNSTVEPTYADVTNVQQLGEALTERINKFNIIRDGEEHEAGFSDNGKPVYYLATSDIMIGYNKSKIIKSEVNIDYVLFSSVSSVVGTNENTNTLVSNVKYGGDGCHIIWNKSRNRIDITTTGSTWGVLSYPIIFYTKTTDSVVL